MSEKEELVVVDTDNFLERYAEWARTIGFDLALSGWFGMTLGLFVAVTKAYVMGIDELKAYNAGILVGMLTIPVSATILGLKNGWLKKLMKKGD